MLNITSQQGNANQNHSELSPLTCRSGCSQKDKEVQVSLRMWGEGNLTHCGWECKPVPPLWKTVRGFLENKTRTTTRSGKLTAGVCVTQRKH